MSNTQKPIVAVGTVLAAGTVKAINNDHVLICLLYTSDAADE